MWNGIQRIGDSTSLIFLVKLKTKYLVNKGSGKTNQVTADGEQAAASVDMQPEKPKRKANGNFICTTCQKDFKLRPSWYNHTKIHRNIRYEYPLLSCQYWCKSESTYKEHCKYYHHKSKTVPCKVKSCKHMFQMPTDMFQHVTMHHK